MRKVKQEVEVAREALESMGTVQKGAGASRARQAALAALQERFARVQRRALSLQESEDEADAPLDTLDVSGGRLVELQRLGAASEEEGARALARLQGQRGQLEQADTTLGRLDYGLSRARSLLGGMLRRALLSKAVLWGVVGVLVLAIALIIFFHWLLPLARAVQALSPPPAPAPSPSALAL